MVSTTSSAGRPPPPRLRFSSGSSEQVEYTSRPPGASAASALRSSAVWRRVQIVRSAGRKPPLDFRIAPQRARARAGRIHQDAVEAPRERQRPRAIQHHQVGRRGSACCAQAMEVQIAGHRAHARFERLRGLVAGRGAQIEEASGPARGRAAARWIASRYPGVRRAAYVFFRLLKRRARDGGRGFGAVMALPARQQPLRAGKLHLATRPRDRARDPPCRSTAFTKPAAERLRARLTSSTLPPPRRAPECAPDSEAGRCPCAARCALPRRASAGGPA